jgi:hypothetical protein
MDDLHGRTPRSQSALVGLPLCPAPFLAAIRRERPVKGGRQATAAAARSVLDGAVPTDTLGETAAALSGVGWSFLVDCPSAYPWGSAPPAGSVWLRVEPEALSAPVAADGAGSAAEAEPEASDSPTGTSASRLGSHGVRVPARSPEFALSLGVNPPQGQEAAQAKEPARSASLRPGNEESLTGLHRLAGVAGTGGVFGGPADGHR